MGKYLDLLKPDRTEQETPRQETPASTESTPLSGEGGLPSRGGSTPTTSAKKTTRGGPASTSGEGRVDHARPAPGGTTKTTETTKVPSAPPVGDPSRPRRAAAPLPQASRFLGMSLSEFAGVQSCLEVEVPDLRETLWFVSGPDQVEKLRLDGIRRGRIWTAAELRDLLKAPGMTTEEALSIARAKMAFSAHVVDVRPARPPESQRPADTPQPRQPKLDLGSGTTETD